MNLSIGDILYLRVIGYLQFYDCSFAFANCIKQGKTVFNPVDRRGKVQSMHVYQVKTFGALQTDAMARMFENAAYRSEKDWWKYFQLMNGGN